MNYNLVLLINRKSHFQEMPRDSFLERLEEKIEGTEVSLKVDHTILKVVRVQCKYLQQLILDHLVNELHYPHVLLSSLCMCTLHSCTSESGPLK